MEATVEVTVLQAGTQQGGGSSRNKSWQETSIWRRRAVSTLDGPIWSKYSIALTYPARFHFQRTLSKDRWVQGWDERYRSSRKEERGDQDGHEKGRRKEKTGYRF